VILIKANGNQLTLRHPSLSVSRRIVFDLTFLATDPITKLNGRLVHYNNPACNISIELGT